MYKNGDVASDVVKDREHQLIEYNKILKQNFVSQNINKQHKVVVEEYTDGYSCGYSENYLYCYINQKLEEGKIVKVVPKSPFKNGVLCEIVK